MDIIGRKGRHDRGSYLASCKVLSLGVNAPCHSLDLGFTSPAAETVDMCDETQNWLLSEGHMDESGFKYLNSSLIPYATVISGSSLSAAMAAAFMSSRA